MVNPTIFISYSHRDEKWKDRLMPQLKALMNVAQLDVWEDRQIAFGEDWYEKIQTSIASAVAAVCLVSADFLASKFCQQEEVPALLKKRQSSGLLLLPILLSDCPWQSIPWLSSIQMIPRDGRNVEEHFSRNWKKLFADIARQIAESVQAMTHGPYMDKIGTEGTASNEHGLVPDYLNEDVRLFSEQIQSAIARLNRLKTAGASRSVVKSAKDELINLRRKIREGRQLVAGDVLSYRYLLLESVGSGGFATVWKASDLKNNRIVAIKILHGQFSHDRTYRERFFRGAREMTRLFHPNIAEVLDRRCKDNNIFYFVMEYLGLGNLRDAIIEKRLTTSESLGIIIKIGEALKYAHECGVVHRDVKPANILIDSEDKFKLTDFDLVMVVGSTGGTRTGALGTFFFAAPEALISAKTADIRADVYSLAMTAVFCLYGKELPMDVLRNTSRFVEELQCGSRIKIVLNRALTWQLRNRYQTMDAFCKALSLAVENESRKSTDSQLVQKYGDLIRNIAHLEHSSDSTPVNKSKYPKEEIADALNLAGLFDLKDLISYSRHIGILDTKVDDPDPGVLTQRQLMVLKLLVEGLNSKQIAEELWLSRRTVESHRQAINDRLQVNSIVELTRWAIRQGIIDA